MLMCFCILAGSLAIPSVYIDFEIRKDYIAKVLCINKDKPITMCGGKCFLTRRLQEAAEQSEHQEQNTVRGLQINFDQPVAVQYINKPDALPLRKEFAIAQTDMSDLLFHHDIFHPPQFS